MPFSERDSVDHPVSIYAATKKANELMAHTYSHLYGLPTTGLRFFTVYGTWGRPDMALFLFTKAILEGRPIDVFNHGKMKRDFTYVDDIVEGVIRTLDRTAEPDAAFDSDRPDPGRSKFATLTIPVMYSSLQTYVRADDHRFDGNLEKINSGDVMIPAIEGDVSVTMAQNRFPQAKLLMLPQTATLSEMFISVTTKKADVMFLDHAMFEALDKENKGVLRELEKVPDSFVFASYYAVKSGEFALRDSLNIALRTLIDNGRIETLAHKYSPNYKAPKKNF